MDHTLIRVALVIPVHNRREITLKCLRSLARIKDSGLEVHTFIVDDGSTDGTSEAIRLEFPRVSLIAGDGTLHYAAGTNRGIEAALTLEPDYIVTMNDDAVYHESFLQSMVRTASREPHSIIGALLLLWDEPHRVFQVSPKWTSRRGGWTFSDKLTAFNIGTEPFEVEGIVGNCVLFPAEAIREQGMMDEKKFPHGWGDAQYIARFRKAGWKLLIDPRALVWCEPNTYPQSLHKMSAGRIVEVLFRDRRHPQNLQRQFIALWESAPTKAQAIVAFGSYVVILLGKSVRFARIRLVGRNDRKS